MVTYSEVDIRVSPSGDLSIGPNGDFALANPSGVLYQDISFRLKTDYDDFTPHPDIGADLSSLIGEPNSRDTGKKIEQKVVRSLTCDGRIFNGDLMVTAVPINLSSVACYVFVKDGLSVVNVTPDMVLDVNKGILSY